MKTRNLLLITILTIFLSTNCFAQIQNFEWQNVQREYLVKTPKNYETLPVLFFLHGLGDNITRLDNVNGVYFIKANGMTRSIIVESPVSFR